MKLRILKSEVTNPWFNLATEDWIFNTLNPDSHTLFLWRNSETVVIGRSQNPWVECKTDKMAEDDVFLARRQSGGGAVFHDLGNTNFTFLSPKADYDQDANFTIIINALKKLGVDATLSGRNDMQVGDRKISGSAFNTASIAAFTMAPYWLMPICKSSATISTHTRSNCKPKASSQYAHEWQIWSNLMTLSTTRPSLKP